MRPLALTSLALLAFGCTNTNDVFELGEDAEDLLVHNSDAILVGAPGSLVGASIAYVGDLNGDGFDDAVVADREYMRPTDAHQRGAAYVVYGGPMSGDIPLGDGVIELDPGGGPAETSVSKAGDVDGDGLADLLIAQTGQEACMPADPDVERRGGAYLVYGGAERILGKRAVGDVAVAFLDPAPCTRAGIYATGLGDIDGDGYADFAVGADEPGDDVTLEGGGRVYVYYGSATRFVGTADLSAADAVIVGGTSSSYFGARIAGAGDVDGDGYADFLVRDRAATHLVRGSATRLAGERSVPDVATPLGPEWSFEVAGLGDLDEDGYDDFAISSSSDYELVLLYYGGAGSFETPDAVLRGTTAFLGSRSIASGDTDADGHLDLVIGDVELESGRGGAYLLHGTGKRWVGEIELSLVASRVLIGSKHTVVEELEEGTYESTYVDLAGSAVAAGDLNGDGRADFGVGAHTNLIGGALGGRVYVLLGGAAWSK